MDVKLLSVNEVAEAVKVARGVFDYCLRPRMNSVESIGFFEQYATVENLTAMMLENKLYLWGMYQQGHMIAMSAMQSEGHITMIYVLPYFQRHGFGSDLLHAMRVFANQKLHVDWVTVNAMPEWTANYFYKKKFSVMLNHVQAPGQYTALCAKSIAEVSYEKKEFSQGWVIATTLAGLLLCTGVTVYYLASAMGWM